MTGKVVTYYSHPVMDYTSANFSDSLSENLEDVTYTYTPMQVATAVTLMVGIYQVNITYYFSKYNLIK